MQPLKKITDQTYINNIISGHNKYLLPITLSLTNNIETLTKYATNQKIDTQNRCIAISRLSNQQIIANLAKYDLNDEVRYTAVLYLNTKENKDLLLDIGLYDEKDYIRDEALNKLFPETWQSISDEINLILIFGPEEGKSDDLELNNLKKRLLEELD